jgi:hypothetical protein
MMERRIDDPGRHAACDFCAQARLASAALHAQLISLFQLAVFGVVWTNFQHVLFVPAAVFRASRLRADIILRQYPARGEKKGSSLPVAPLIE